MYLLPTTAKSFITELILFSPPWTHPIDTTHPAWHLLNSSINHSPTQLLCHHSRETCGNWSWYSRSRRSILPTKRDFSTAPLNSPTVFKWYMVTYAFPRGNHFWQFKLQKKKICDKVPAASSVLKSISAALQHHWFLCELSEEVFLTPGLV